MGSVARDRGRPSSVDEGGGVWRYEDESKAFQKLLGLPAPWYLRLLRPA